MSVFEKWVDEILREREDEMLEAAHLANSVYGSWDEFERQAPARKWVRTEGGWTSRRRDHNWAAI